MRVLRLLNIQLNSQRCNGIGGISMTLQEIRQALVALSALRRGGVDDSLMSYLRQELAPNKPKRITEEELRQRVAALEAEVEGFHVIWD